MTVVGSAVAADDPARVGSGEVRLRSRLHAVRGDAAGEQTVDEVLGLLDSGRLRPLVGAFRLVDRASETAVRSGVDRIIELPSPLGDLLPGRGLRRGSTVTVQGATALLLVILAAASRAGCWCAVVGMPQLGVAAAAELGVRLDRLALVPNPGPDWPQVTAALLDGIDVVAVATPTAAAAVPARQLVARARHRGAVLIGVGGWPTAELTLEADLGTWDGLGQGRGRLRCRRVTVVVRGRGAAERPRQARMWLPALTGPLRMVTGPVSSDPAAASVSPRAGCRVRPQAGSTVGDGVRTAPNRGGCRSR